MINLLKNGFIGVVIWVILLVLFFIGASIGVNPCQAGGEHLIGVSCYTPFQEFFALFIFFVGFIGIITGGSPVLSSVGPTGVLLFYLGSVFTFFLWGILIGFIIKKIRK